MSDSTSTEAPREPQTRAEILSALEDFDGAIKALNDSGLDNLSPEELADLEAFVDERETLREQLDAMPDVSAIKARIDDHDARKRTVKRPSLGATSTDGAGTKARLDAAESEDDKYLLTGPFKSTGHYLYEVRKAGDRPGLAREGKLGEWNHRITKIDSAVKSMDDDIKAISGLGELLDSEGASLIPLQFSQGIWERPINMPDLFGMIQATPVSGNSLTFNCWNDKTRTSNTVYGGFLAYHRAEAGLMSGTKPQTRNVTLKLNELYLLYYATDELLEDAPAMEVELERGARTALATKLNDLVINGTGTGQGQGLLSSPAKITVAAESGQGANTIVGKNIVNMWGRRAPGGGQVWLYNLDCEPQFQQMYLSTGTYSGQLVYMPPGGVSQSQYGTLIGRPTMETEHCQALGTEGDVIQWQPESYRAIVKASGIKNAVSMHVRFLYGETAFRFTFRYDFRSIWDAVLTPVRGTNTRAPVVTLNSTRT
jgi:HK97 family phage major capsid protein